MKRVLHYGLSGNKGGIEVVAINVFRSINREKVLFDFLISGETIAFEEEITKLGGTVYKLPKRRKNPLRYYVEYVRFFAKNAKKFDAIHCSYCSLYSILPIILAKVFGVPQIILHAHSNSFNTKRFRLRLAHYINRFLADIIATDFIACSDSAGKFMFTRKRFESQGYVVFRNPVMVRKFDFNEEVRNIVRKDLQLQNAFVLGHVGAFLPVKNHMFIIDVFCKLLKLNSNSRLLLVGDGREFNSIKKKCELLGIEDKVIFTGMVDNTYDYMQAMDAFIFPSLYEGFGNVVIEAQAAGLSCFVSESVPNEVKLTDLVSFVSLDKSPSLWAEQILDKTRRTQRRGMAAEIEKHGFSTETCIREYEKLYGVD